MILILIGIRSFSGCNQAIGKVRFSGSEPQLEVSCFDPSTVAPSFRLISVLISILHDHLINWTGHLSGMNIPGKESTQQRNKVRK